MSTFKRKYLTLTVMVAIVAVVLILYARPAPPITLTLNFNAVVETESGAEPLAFNTPKYPNPGGDGHFKIRDFQLYLSNIQLIGENGEYKEPDSYHLVRFSSKSSTFSFTLEQIPYDRYHTLNFAIGVDSAANGSIKSAGDLNPNSRMAWSWDTGYKFVLLEGRLETPSEKGNKLIPLVYHIGFDENYKTLTMKLEPSLLASSLFIPGLFSDSTATLNFTVDPTKMFTGQQTIDLAALPSVKFDRTDSSIIANNYQDMITLDKP